MSYKFEELKKNSVAQLREIAKGIEHEAVKGYTQLNKEHLLEAICKALDIDMHEHHKVVGIDKKSIKSEIKRLKTKRDEYIAAKNYGDLKKVRHQIHELKNKLRRFMV
ncbi:MAG: hypothetical protein AB7T22_17160 [Calditrichaceae bacterium]